MEFPVVEFPWLGSGTVIALIAVLHVVINHAFAIGGSVLMVGLEHKGWKENNPGLEQTARKMSKWILIITTTVGAMTGVGIWFATTVIQPYAIGSLLRVFFWAWFVEWIVFVTEVVLLLVYFYTWDRWTGAKKKWHIRTGVALSIASWLTMTIITAVLAAMLTPGQWVETRSFWDAVANPTWLPSLMFRTFVALALAVALFTPIMKMIVKDDGLQAKILKYFGKWMLVSIYFMIAFGAWYVFSVPDKAYSMIVWASGLQGKEQWFRMINLGALAIMLVMALWLLNRPRKVPIVVSALVAFVSIGLIGEFEMVREAIRKPYVVYDYMYVNGVRVDQVEQFKQEGFLTNSKWLGVSNVTEQNRLEAGHALYVAQCSSCHTIDGWRSKRAFANRIQGWDATQLSNYVNSLHNARYFMPPFAGTDQERQALAEYLVQAVKETSTAQQTAAKER